MSALSSRAPSKTLADHGDFLILVRSSAEYCGILPALVLKDYWVTRALRAIAGDPDLQRRVLFKGGTSLSKGWRLIDRFSEDVDLLLTGPDFGPPPDRSADRKSLLKHVQARVQADTPLRLPEQQSISRAEWNEVYIRTNHHSRLRYALPQIPGVPGSNARGDAVVLESGFRGHPYPNERRSLGSMIAEYLHTRSDVVATLADYNEDLASFEMDLLRPERTFAEKLMALDGNMRRGVEGAKDLPTRHYYDVAQLYEKHAGVRACVSSGEIQALVRDVAEVSNLHFGANIDVERFDLRASSALNVSAEQAAILMPRYASSSEKPLYYRGQPPFEDILRIVAEIREALPSP